MRRHVPTMLCVAFLIVTTACSAAGVPDETPDAFDGISADGARPLPTGGPFVEGRLGPDGGTIFAPTSARVEHGVPYEFTLGHCGLGSPVDIDGSFWNPIDGLTPAARPLDLEADGEMINATSGVIVVIADEARFRTGTGSVVHFDRHAGDKEFPGCL